MIKFKAEFDQIYAREVLRETAQKVVVMGSGYQHNGTREIFESKRTDICSWHDTWAEAKAYLVERAEADARTAKLKYEAKVLRADRIKGMKEPE